MASHIRGDDDVLALLNEMTGGGDGGGTSLTSATGDLPKTSADNNRLDDMDTTTQQHNINNKAYESLLSAYKLSPPTNIHVEIIRHRAHEKFKSNFYELFRNCVASHQSASSTSSTNMSGSTTNKEDVRNQCMRSTINKLWKVMPVHSIWERFQFTLKTCEADCVREVQQQQSNFIQPWCSTTSSISDDQLIQHLVNPTIHEIQAYILHGRNNGTIWEPLLPVSTISSSSTSSHHEEINEKYKQATLQLLQEEIKFQMRRTFKQLIHGGGRSSSKGESLSLDKLYDTLRCEEEGMTTDDHRTTDDSKKKKKKKKSKKKRKDKEDTNNNKEEYILQTIYKSISFTKLTNKLHKKFMYLAEDSYNTNFLNELSKCCNRLLMEEQSNNGGGGISSKKKKKRKRKSSSSSMPKITLVENDNSTSGSIRKTNNQQQQQQQQLMVLFQGISLRINQVHKDKLYSMYQHTLSTLLPGATNNNMIDEYLQQFPKLLFTILLRYDALEGAGLQSAIPSSVFDYLNNRFGCNFECFASPFNCWLEEQQEEESVSSNGSSSSSMVRGGNFGSVFADTDALFGSRGSFFGMDFVKMTVGEDGGCFQANPPFASEFIQRMCNYMHLFLGDDEDNYNDDEDNDDGDGSKKKTVPLMFVIFVPSWSESAGWKTLSSSPHLTKHILLSQKDDVHYYSEGTQHRRTLDNGGSYRIASFDTSVFFLQNKAAKKKWPLLEEDDSDDETRLKAAFAMNTKDEEKKAVLKKKKTSPKSSVKSKESVEKQQPHDSASAMVSDKQKKRKKKQKVDHKGSSKKKRLISGGNDEMSILQSMGILDDSVVSKVEKTGSSGKKKKRRHKR